MALGDFLARLIRGVAPPATTSLGGLLQGLQQYYQTLVNIGREEERRRQEMLQNLMSLAYVKQQEELKRQTMELERQKAQQTAELMRAEKMGKAIDATLPFGRLVASEIQKVLNEHFDPNKLVLQLSKVDATPEDIYKFIDELDASPALKNEIENRLNDAKKWIAARLKPWGFSPDEIEEIAQAVLPNAQMWLQQKQDVVQAYKAYVDAYLAGQDIAKTEELFKSVQGPRGPIATFLTALNRELSFTQKITPERAQQLRGEIAAYKDILTSFWDKQPKAVKDKPKLQAEYNFLLTTLDNLAKGIPTGLSWKGAIDTSKLRLATENFNLRYQKYLLDKAKYDWQRAQQATKSPVLLAQEVRRIAQTYNDIIQYLSIFPNADPKLYELKDKLGNLVDVFSSQLQEGGMSVPFVLAPQAGGVAPSTLQIPTTGASPLLPPTPGVIDPLQRPIIYPSNSPPPGAPASPLKDAIVMRDPQYNTYIAMNDKHIAIQDPQTNQWFVAPLEKTHEVASQLPAIKSPPEETLLPPPTKPSAAITSKPLFKDRVRPGAKNLINSLNAMGKPEWGVGWQPKTIWDPDFKAALEKYAIPLANWVRLQFGEYKYSQELRGKKGWADCSAFAMKLFNSLKAPLGYHYPGDKLPLWSGYNIALSPYGVNVLDPEFVKLYPEEADHLEPLDMILVRYPPQKKKPWSGHVLVVLSPFPVKDRKGNWYWDYLVAEMGGKEGEKGLKFTTFSGVLERYKTPGSGGVYAIVRFLPKDVATKLEGCRFTSPSDLLNWSGKVVSGKFLPRDVWYNHIKKQVMPTTPARIAKSFQKVWQTTIFTSPQEYEILQRNWKNIDKNAEAISYLALFHGIPFEGGRTLGHFLNTAIGANPNITGILEKIFFDEREYNTPAIKEFRAFIKGLGIPPSAFWTKFLEAVNDPRFQGFPAKFLKSDNKELIEQYNKIISNPLYKRHLPAIQQLVAEIYSIVNPIVSATGYEKRLTPWQILKDMFISGYKLAKGGVEFLLQAGGIVFPTAEAWAEAGKRAKAEGKGFWPSLLESWRAAWGEAKRYAKETIGAPVAKFLAEGLTTPAYMYIKALPEALGIMTKNKVSWEEALNTLFASDPYASYFSQRLWTDPWGSTVQSIASYLTLFDAFKIGVSATGGAIKAPFQLRNLMRRTAEIRALRGELASAKAIEDPKVRLTRLAEIEQRLANIDKETSQLITNPTLNKLAQRYFEKQPWFKEYSKLREQAAERIRKENIPLEEMPQIYNEVIGKYVAKHPEHLHDIAIAEGILAGDISYADALLNYFPSKLTPLYISHDWIREAIREARPGVQMTIESLEKQWETLKTRLGLSEPYEAFKDLLRNGWNWPELGNALIGTAIKGTIRTVEAVPFILDKVMEITETGAVRRFINELARRILPAKIASWFDSRPSMLIQVMNNERALIMEDITPIAQSFSQDLLALHNHIKTVLSEYYTPERLSTLLTEFKSRKRAKPEIYKKGKGTVRHLTLRDFFKEATDPSGKKILTLKDEGINSFIAEDIIIGEIGTPTLDYALRRAGFPDELIERINTPEAQDLVLKVRRGWTELTNKLADKLHNELLGTLVFTPTQTTARRIQEGVLRIMRDFVKGRTNLFADILSRGVPPDIWVPTLLQAYTVGLHHYFLRALLETAAKRFPEEWAQKGTIFARNATTAVVEHLRQELIKLGAKPEAINAYIELFNSPFDIAEAGNAFLSVIGNPEAMSALMEEVASEIKGAIKPKRKITYGKAAEIVGEPKLREALSYAIVDQIRERFFSHNPELFDAVVEYMDRFLQDNKSLAEALTPQQITQMLEVMTPSYATRIPANIVKKIVERVQGIHLPFGPEFDEITSELQFWRRKTAPGLKAMRKGHPITVSPEELLIATTEVSLHPLIEIATQEYFNTSIGRPLIIDTPEALTRIINDPAHKGKIIIAVPRQLRRLTVEEWRKAVEDARKALEENPHLDYHDVLDKVLGEAMLDVSFPGKRVVAFDLLIDPATGKFYYDTEEAFVNATRGTIPREVARDLWKHTSKEFLDEVKKNPSRYIFTEIDPKSYATFVLAREKLRGIEAGLLAKYIRPLRNIWAKYLLGLPPVAITWVIQNNLSNILLGLYNGLTPMELLGAMRRLPRLGKLPEFRRLLYETLAKEGLTAMTDEPIFTWQGIIGDAEEISAWKKLWTEAKEIADKINIPGRIADLTRFINEKGERWAREIQATAFAQKTLRDPVFLRELIKEVEKGKMPFSALGEVVNLIRTTATLEELFSSPHYSPAADLLIRHVRERLGRSLGHYSVTSPAERIITTTLFPFWKFQRIVLSYFIYYPFEHPQWFTQMLALGDMWDQRRALVYLLTYNKQLREQFRLDVEDLIALEPTIQAISWNDLSKWQQEAVVPFKAGKTLFTISLPQLFPYTMLYTPIANLENKEGALDVIGQFILTMTNPWVSALVLPIVKRHPFMRLPDIFKLPYNDRLNWVNKGQLITFDRKTGEMWVSSPSESYVKLVWNTLLQNGLPILNNVLRAARNVGDALKYHNIAFPEWMTFLFGAPPPKGEKPTPENVFPIIAAILGISNLIRTENPRLFRQRMQFHPPGKALSPQDKIIKALEFYRYYIKPKMKRGYDVSSLINYVRDFIGKVMEEAKQPLEMPEMVKEIMETAERGDIHRLQKAEGGVP